MSRIRGGGRSPLSVASWQDSGPEKPGKPSEPLSFNPNRQLNVSGAETPRPEGGGLPPEAPQSQRGSAVGGRLTLHHPEWKGSSLFGVGFLC